MPVQVLKDKNSGKVLNVTIGSGDAAVTVGGATSLPFLHFEGETPNKPIVAMEVTDVAPEWNQVLLDAFADVINDPVAWAKKCVDECHADMVCLKLIGSDPEVGNHSAEDCIKIVKDIKAAINVPLAVVGCGIDEIDNQVIAAIAEACTGENLLLGNAKQENYNTIAAACMVHKHTLIAQSPLDINICKQLNILISEMGMPLDRVVLDPSIGGLGYGIEYAYSVQERSRIGSLQGDKMLGMPLIGTVGFEAWKAKEAQVGEDEFPGWGDQAERGILWETLTATTLLQAGIDILLMRHPKAVALVHKNIEELMVPSNV